MSATTHSHIHIDGSQGEGGGQMLRSALTLSMLTGKPFSIEHIRAKRKKPGLLRQHLTAVNAAACISSAYTQGAELGSTALTFEPGPTHGGVFDFSIGSAGSTMLILQTILLPLCIAKQPSKVTLAGGTHNHFAPPFEFLQLAFLPLLERMGASVRMQLLKPGSFRQVAEGGDRDRSLRSAQALRAARARRAHVAPGHRHCQQLAREHRGPRAEGGARPFKVRTQ